MNRRASFALAMALTVGGLSAAPLDPQRWRDEYIADPARKTMLERYETPMGTEVETALRTLTLAKVIATRCRGSAFEPEIVADYVKESGLDRQTARAVELATAIVNAEFSYFDLTRLKVACAAAGHLFGDKGVLVPGLVSSGLGLPVWNEPRYEHWITVEPFLIHVDGMTKHLGAGSSPRRAPPLPGRRRI